MKKKNKIILSLLGVFLGFFSMQAQLMEAPEWKFSVAASESAEDNLSLQFEAEIPEGWYMYSSDFSEEVGPMVTEFSFIPSDTYELQGEVVPIDPKKKYDELWAGEYTYFTGTAHFTQEVLVTGEETSYQGSISYQICSDESGQCIPFETSFHFDEKGSSLLRESDKEQSSLFAYGVGEEGQENPDLGPPASATERGAQDTGEPPVVKMEPFNNPYIEESGDTERTWGSLLNFFLLSFAGGLAALLTPCVFPMIPMTVSYFTKGSGSRGKMNAMIYGLFIILIYTVVGTLVTLIFGAGFANFLSTHWLPNLLFFAIFVIFALSFFGLFEITLPNSFVNRIDKQADRGGVLGIFFMAFTLVLVGFSCTGPIAGTILLQAASGEAIMPIVGMLGFSMAFAIPFTLFAIFPGWLSSLPKSGGWMNTVKVVLGFLELALALKFLSMVDQVYHWELLDREIYLALWIAIFGLLGFYLLGKLVFPHEEKPERTTIPRLLSAILVFSFVIYLIPGLFGAPLKSLSGYLPPMGSQDFNLMQPAGLADNESLSEGCDSPKYGELLELPHGIQGYFDYEQALACAKKQNKPLFIDFTGHGCVNCREMEASVWSDPQVLKRLKEDYVVVALYVDEKTKLPQEEWYISAYDGNLKSSMGKQNLDFMIQKLNANAQPYYTLVGADENLLNAPKGYDLSVESFTEFLDRGVENFEKRKILN